MADPSLIQALAKEMMKIMKGKQSTEPQTSHMSAYAQFAGTVPMSSQSIACSAVHNNLDSWIVDTGASDHMTSNSASFNSTKPLSQPVHVMLPDGTVKLVTHRGYIPLSQNITLQNVLHVPEFKYNLLSVSKLLSDNNLCAIFYPEKCFFQDLSTELIVAAGKREGGLYFLINFPAGQALSSSNSATVAVRISSADASHTNSQSSLASCFSDKPVCTLEIFHARLGHTSSLKMQHIPDCKGFLSTPPFL